MSETSGVQEAIALAESLLPGEPAAEGEQDERWQAIIEVEDFIESEPEAVWQFVVKWGCHESEDVRAAIGCCLLEHLLENHFDRFFNPALELAKRDRFFRGTFEMCWGLSAAHEREFEVARASLGDIPD